MRSVLVQTELSVNILTSRWQQKQVSPQSPFNIPQCLVLSFTAEYEAASNSEET